MATGGFPRDGFSSRRTCPTTPAQELAFARQHFFTPHRSRDPFGNTAFVGYDAYDLLLKQTTDPLGNRTTAEHDYRLLQPFRVTDPNGNRTEVAFDTLGLVAGTAVMGKVTETEGRLPGRVRAGSDSATTSRLSSPIRWATPPLLLGQATTRIVYDLDRYRTSATAGVRSHARARNPCERSAPARRTQGPGGLSYSDGFGREIQKKIQAEPGPVVDGGPIGQPALGRQRVDDLQQQGQADQAV